MKSFKLNEELIDKIISVAYNDASIWDKLLIYRLAYQYDNVRKILDDYRTIAAEVNKIKEEECPEKLIQTLSFKNGVTNINSRRSFMADLYAAIFTKPFISVAVSLVLIASIAFGVFTNRRIQYQHQYSKADIQFAEEQAKQAFAIVGKIFDETNVTLKNEVIKSRIAKPIGESIGIVNNLINKGEIQ